MAADRRIDPAGRIGKFGAQRLVERLAHAVEPLKLEALDAAGILDHAGHRQRIMGGELRRTADRARARSRFGASHVTEIGHRLAGEHRIIGEAALLRALDLGVPIGAFDQPHREPAVPAAAAASIQSITAKRALLIGLHRKPKPVPAAKRRIVRARRR